MADYFSFFIRKLFVVKWLIVVEKDGGEAMIKSIYETHVQVRNLENSILFYKRLGLTFVHRVEERRCAFFFVGGQKQMLGLWETDEKELKTSHFAFGIEAADIHQALTWLSLKGIEPEKTSFGKPQTEPIVHTWMPAACVYFNDPDGNRLELITLLNDEPVVSKDFPYLSEWNKKQQ